MGFDAFTQGDGKQQAFAAEPDVRNPVAAIEMHQEQHVRAWQDRVGTVADARGEGRQSETQPLQYRREQQVLLEAVAAALSRYQFVRQAGKVDQDGPLQQDVEILEGNVGGMRKVERLQRRRIGKDRL